MTPDAPNAAAELLRLASADNFRDVAGSGAGHATADGGNVRRGVFFRSNELQLTKADASAIATLGVAAVHDLRGAEEIEYHPDVPVPGTSWHHFDVSGIPMDDVIGLETRDAAIEVMHRVYRGFVEDPGSRSAFGALFARLAEGEGAQLFHCTAGKDRTGWVAALLLHLAGVHHDVIVADYLLTNDYARASRSTYLSMVEAGLGPDKVEVYERVLVADATYLATAYAAADAAYGSVEGYLTEGLGLSRVTLESLVVKLRI